MKNSLFKKYFALLLAVLMLFTAVPAGVFAAEKDCPVMMATNAASSKGYYKYYNKIYTITFLDEIKVEGTPLEQWDMSAAGDGSVWGWMYLNEEATAAAGVNRYDVYVAGDGGVAVNPNSTHLFYMFESLTAVNNPENLKTSGVTSFYMMFSKCYSLKSIDLSSWDVSSVTSLQNMFDMATPKNSPIIPALESVNLSNWDTGNVTNMGYMFNNCKVIKEIDISSFNTSKVTNMAHLFYNCHELANVYVGSGWNIDNVVNGDSVFNCCYALPGYDDNNSKTDISFATTGENGFLKPESEKPKAEKYTVTYTFVGDIIPENVTAPAAVTYEKGDTVTVAAAASAEHYIFSGWKTEDKADIENGEFVINNDVEFVGSWTKLYKVVYEYDKRYMLPDGAPELPDVEYWYAPGEEVPVYGTLYYPEYVFVGWTSNDAEIVGDGFVMPASDVVIRGFFKKPVESIEIWTEDFDLDVKDEEGKKIDVYIKPEDATIKDLVYISSNEDVVKVDKDGIITPVGKGTATVTVQSVDNPEKSDTITVTVKTLVTDIEVDKTDITLYKDETEKVTGTVIPDDATDKKVVYTSKDEEIARVDENGNITAVGEGTTTITVSSEDNPDVKKEVTVTVKIPVTEITAKDDITLNVGDTDNVDASVNEDATVKGVTYESDNPGVVKVDSEGNVTAVGKGTATITVTSTDNPDVTKTITVTVEIPVEDITVDKDNITIVEGDTDKITVTVTPSNATETGVTFKSDNPDAVTVDEKGNIKAVGEGEATITVTSKYDPSITESVTVTVLGKYNVRYEYVGEVPAGAPELPAEKEWATGDKVAVAEAPEVDGYTFSGWSSDDAELENGKFTMPKNDVVLKGSFEKIIIGVDEIKVDKTKVELEVGEDEKITVTVTPDNATDKSVIYTSSDESVAAVDKDGTITAVGKGTATITVTSKDNPEKYVEVEVTVVKPVTGITVEKDELELETGEEGSVEAKIIPDDASNGKIIYTSENSDIVTVDENGKLTAIKEGTTVITATSEENPDISISVTVTVKNPEPEKVPVNKVDILSSDIKLDVGEGKTITYIVYPNHATDKTVTFESSDENVATIDQSGNIKAVGEGEATIRVTSNDDPTKYDEIKVVVTKPDVPLESISAKEMELDIGDTEKLEVAFTPEDTTNKKLSYSSTDESIVTVDENGNVTAVGKGTAYIKVTPNDKPTAYINVKVTVNVPVTDINLAEKEIELEEGNSYTVTATVAPDNATDKGVVYTSSDESVVTVDKNGKITAVKAGTATITASSASDPEVKKTVTVKVNPPKNPGYTIVTPESVSIKEGETKNLGVTITPNDGTIKPAYKSSDEGVVTVDADGNISGIKAGMAAITVDFGNGDIRIIPVVVDEVVIVPVVQHIVFGKTDGIGWYEVSVNGGDFFAQGPNSTLEVNQGDVLVVRVQDMWIDDDFDFYVNGTKVDKDAANTITVVVDGYMLIGALSMDVEVPDVDESVSFLDKITNFFANIINWFKNLFKW